MDAALVFIAAHEDQVAPLVIAALRSTSRRLYLYFAENNQEGPNPQLLTFLAHLYDLTAVEKPCLDVLPLLPFAGWSPERVANRLDLNAIYFGSSSAHSGSRNKAEKLLQLRSPDLQPVALQSLDTSHELNAGGEGQQEASSGVEVSGAGGADGADGGLQFAKVAVGGTFDRLHAGHRTLLASTALVATGLVYIGVTGDQLLVHKEHKELLEGYQRRQDAAVNFVLATRPGLQILAGPLLDPKKRTAAAEDPSMEALVVSQETKAGGEAINWDRQQQGFKELALVVVNLVGLGSKALGGQKLSSTALRAKDAEAQTSWH